MPKDDRLNMWLQLHDFFETINELEYVILRNMENPFCDNSQGEDTDILCINKSVLCSTLKLQPVNIASVYNYYTLINGKKVRIDVREVGDGYYDEGWEKILLSRRIKKNGVYVLGDEDYYYSILYHVLIHKHEISKKYVDLLGSDQYGWSHLLKMSKYLRENRFQPSRPRDKGVSINKKHYYLLKTLTLL